MNCEGLEGYIYPPSANNPDHLTNKQLISKLNTANCIYAKQIRKHIDDTFVPIDWHLDFKSGYRWSEDTWYRDINYRGIPGVDPKVPWELSRMYHLPQLALTFGLSREANLERRDPNDYASEFCNQVLDFTASNPPRYGINWFCTMDVAIRAINLLVAYDLFSAYGYKFDPAFEQFFWRSIKEHGYHISTNLERYGSIRNNHYLMNIVGLLFISAYLLEDSQANIWFNFCINEFISESEYQFNPDGSNFEGSTSYHRLSAEAVLYGTALLLAFPNDKSMNVENISNNITFSQHFCNRLKKMAEFSIDLTGPLGHAVQIGDNDSGRLLKLFPIYSDVKKPDEPSSSLRHYEVEENTLDHKHLIAGISALYSDSNLDDFAGIDHPERELISKVAKLKKLSLDQSKDAQFINASKENILTNRLDDLDTFLSTWENTAKPQRQYIKFPLPVSAGQYQITTNAYPYFGAFIIQSNTFYLAIRCGGEKITYPRGHHHNDQLSIELWISKKCIIGDPGSYIYVALEEKRNQYRSVSAHFTPQVISKEPSSLQKGLFQLGPPTKAECLHFSESGFVGRHIGYGDWIWRNIKINNDSIEIFDLIDSTQHVLKNNDDILRDAPLFSSGYGIIKP